MILEAGKSIALVSDAGMPGICDPGEELVRCKIMQDMMLFVYQDLVLQLQH